MFLARRNIIKGLLEFYWEKKGIVSVDGGGIISTYKIGKKNLENLLLVSEWKIA